MAEIKLPNKKPVPPTPVIPKYGDLHPATSLFLHIGVGDAKNGKNRYSMSTHMGGGHPIVKSEQTGRSWSIRWARIIELAIADGVDAPLTKDEQKAWGWAAKKRAT